MRATPPPIDAAALVALLDAHAPFAPCPDVPGLSAWHTDDEVPLWQALEANAGGTVPVPYFAIAWPAARVVARALLDGALREVIDVRGKRVADVGCGSGLVACAAMMAGARSALALDADPRATLAAAELCRRHGVLIAPRAADALQAPEAVDADVIICADLVSRQEHAAPFAVALQAWRRVGRRVVLADSGRPFFDPHGARLVHTRTVDVGTRVDGVGTREVRIFFL